MGILHVMKTHLLASPKCVSWEAFVEVRRTDEKAPQQAQGRDASEKSIAERKTTVMAKSREVGGTTLTVLMHPKRGVIISMCLLVLTLSTPAFWEFQKQAEIVPQAQVGGAWLDHHFQGLSRLFLCAMQPSADEGLGKANLGDTFEADAEAGHQRRKAGNFQELRPGEF